MISFVCSHLATGSEAACPLHLKSILKSEAQSTNTCKLQKCFIPCLRMNFGLLRVGDMRLELYSKVQLLLLSCSGGRSGRV